MSGERRGLLTATEWSILLLLANTGGTNKELSRDAQMNQKTLATHLQNIMNKLRVHTRSALVVWTWQHGYVVEREFHPRAIGMRLVGREGDDAMRATEDDEL